MPKWLDRTFVNKAVLAVSSAFVGVGVCLLLYCWEALKFNPSITLGQVVQIGTLLLIFFWANLVYAKAHDIRKKRIEILVDMVGDILVQVQQAHSIVLECSGQDLISTDKRLRLDNALRDYSNAVNELEQVLNRSPYILETPGFKKLRRDREKYKDLVTAAPYPASLPQNRLTQESKLWSKVRSNLRRFQLQLAEFA